MTWRREQNKVPPMSTHVCKGKRVAFTLKLDADLHSAFRERLKADGRSAQKLLEYVAAAYVEGRLEWPGPPQGSREVVA